MAAGLILADSPSLRTATLLGLSVEPQAGQLDSISENAVRLFHRAEQLADEYRWTDALALVDIRVLDHLIVSGSTVISLAERGVL